MKRTHFTITIDLDHDENVDDLNVEELRKVLLKAIANVLTTGQAPGEFSITKTDEARRVKGRSAMQL